MTGKMEGIDGISTSMLNNPFCQKMRRDGNTVCSHCYSNISEHRFPKNHQMWSNNLKILSENLLKDDEIPKLKCQLFRFSIHGEIVNDTMYRNFIKIAEKNPTVKFALWTKRLDIVNCKTIIILDNLQYNYSSPKLNTPSKIPKGFHRVFTVYTTQYARDNGININCQLKCFNCRKCYTNYTNNDEIYINELIKSSKRDYN